MAGSLTTPVVAAFAIGVGFVALFVIFALPSLLGGQITLDDQVIQLNKEISGFGPKMIVPDDSNRIYATWTSRVENQKSLFNFYFSSSKDNGSTFSQPIVIGNSTRLQGLQVATQGDNFVYIVWNSGDIFFTKSNNSGQTFSDPVNLSNSSLQVRIPSLTASGNLVFVTWSEKTPERADGRIFYRTSHDYGANFSNTANLNNDLSPERNSSLISAINQGDPKIVALNESFVLIGWTEYYADSFASKLAYSTDGGKTFKPSSVASDANGDAFLIQSMQAKDNHIYLVLSNDDDSIFLARSTLDGDELAFSEPVKFGENTLRSSAFVSPPQVDKMLFEGDDNIYILFTVDKFEGGATYYFTSSSDGGKTFAGRFSLLEGGFYYTDMAANGDKVYIIRSGEFGQPTFSTTTMHLLVSTNGGNSFNEVDDYEVEQNAAIFSPDIETAKGTNDIYLLWGETSDNENKILFAKGSN